MPKSENTNGPWRLVQRRAAGAFTPKNGLTLRTLAVDTGSGVWAPKELSSGGYSEEQLTQARLIAAAPDLYEAAMDFLHGYCKENSEAFSERMSDLAYRFRMATNKAEGE